MSTHPSFYLWPKLLCPHQSTISCYLKHQCSHVSKDVLYSVFRKHSIRYLQAFRFGRNATESVRPLPYYQFWSIYRHSFSCQKQIFRFLPFPQFHPSSASYIYICTSVPLIVTQLSQQEPNLWTDTARPLPTYELPASIFEFLHEKTKQNR